MIGLLTLPMLAGAAGNIASLRELATFPVGAAVPAGPAPRSLLASPERQALVAQHFSSLTAENIMKMAYLAPEPGVFHFDDADALVAYARQHGLFMHGHALVWHNQAPPWMNALTGPRDTFVNVLHRHIQTVAGHFAGQLLSWDVVNEAFTDGAQTRYRDTIWYRNIGPDYIEMAFRWAREADPKALLYYNDYDISGAIGPQKLDRILQMVDDFQARGVPLDGIGFQMHIELEKPAVADIRAAYAKVVRRGLKVRLSELDVSVNAARALQELTPAVAAQQQQRYREVVRAYLDVVPPAQRGGITVWGLTDGDSWIPGFKKRADWPLLFDARFQPKPALQGMLEALQ